MHVRQVNLWFQRITVGPQKNIFIQLNQNMSTKLYSSGIWLSVNGQSVYDPVMRHHYPQEWDPQLHGCGNTKTCKNWETHNTR